MSIAEIITPPVPAINYQPKGDLCKACNLPGTGDRPLTVVRMITPNDGVPFVSEHWSHIACVGILLQLHDRSLFQIKYKSNGRETT